MEHPNQTAVEFLNPSRNAVFAEMFESGQLHFHEGTVAPLAHHFKDVFGSAAQMKVIVKFAGEAGRGCLDSIKFLGDTGCVDFHVSFYTSPECGQLRFSG